MVADNELENPTVPVTLNVLHGVVVPMPTLPFPSMTNLSDEPSTVEEAILNLPASAKSAPIVQLAVHIAAVEEAAKRREGLVAAVEPP